MSENNDKKNDHLLLTLTDMEKRILAYIAQNKTSKEIAKILFISYRTVQNHRNNIAQKLNLKGANKLLEFAIENREILALSSEKNDNLLAGKESGSNSGQKKKSKYLWIILSVSIAFFFILVLNDADDFSNILFDGHQSTKSIQTEKRIAVMPFRVIGPDSNEAYLSEGLTEEMITQLSTIPELRVIARSSVMPYSDKHTDVKKIGSDLKVGSVLEGSIQKEEKQIRINVQLIDTETRENIWSQNFDRTFADILNLQREIARQVAVALKVQLYLDGLSGIRQKKKVNEAAHLAYLKGRYFVNQNTGEGFRKAVDFYQESIKIDSTYAKAWAGLADVYTWLSNYGFMVPDKAYSKSRKAAQKAIELDPALGEAHTASGAIALLYDWNFDHAEVEFKKALTLNPSDVVARRLSALLYLARGNSDKALEQSFAALQLDPLSLVSNSLYGRTFYFARQYQNAIRQYENTIEIDPEFWLVHSYLGEVYLETGHPEVALKALKKAVEFTPSNLAANAKLGYGYALTGKKEKALQILQRLVEQSNDGRSLAFQIALIHTALDDKEKAFHWMQKAFENRHDFMLDLKSDPKLDPLRDDPRFDSFLKKMGL